MMSPGQKIVAILVMLVLDVVIFLFAPLLGIIAFFVFLPGVFAILRR